ncbi:MAG: hypothetical protein QM820_16125 [Minicystis sp.]
MAIVAGWYALLRRIAALCFANLGLKLIALVIAVIFHILLVQRAREEPSATEPEPPACQP